MKGAPHMHTLHIAIVIFVVAVVSFFIFTRVEAQSDPVNELFACTVDSDCVSVAPAGQCGCGGGGSAVAINKEHEFEYGQVDADEHIICLAVMSDHETCFQTPTCVANRCELK